MRSRIVHLVMILLIIASILIPVSYGVNSNSSNRLWVPELTISGIELTHTSEEPTENGEYINKTHEVVITIENTGKVVLKNIVISYKVLRGVLTDIGGSDNSKTKLKIAEVYKSKFNWAPVKGDGTSYKVDVTVTAENFGNTFGPIQYFKNFIINDVKKDVGPVDYYFDPPAASLGGEASNSSHTLTARVMNFGNFQLTSVFSASATIYSEATGQQLWTDSKVHSTPISPNGLTEITFNTPWLPPTHGLYRLNLSTALAGDTKQVNDNITLPPIVVGDILDMGVVVINNYVNGEIYRCEPITISAVIKNTGNQNFSIPFSAAIYFNSYPDGANVYSPPPVPIPVTGTSNVSEPGSEVTATFATWDFANNLSPGKFWINISIDPSEQNGSNFNNNFSIMIELLNYTNVLLEFQTPIEGVYYAEDITELAVNVTNSGTDDLEPYTLTIDLNNEYSNESWEKYFEKSDDNGLTAGEYEVQTFSDWDITYNSKFELTVTLVLNSNPTVIVAMDRRVFEIDGGRDNGTLTGWVKDADGGEGIEGVIVKVYLPFVSHPVLTTTTSTDGSYLADISAVPEGRVYKVLVSQKDNYWWEEESANVKVFSGREAEVNITLTRRPVGQLTGKVDLENAPGAPELVPDWTGISVAVENTPILVSTDSQGKFEVELVAGIINVTISKDNFKSVHEQELVVIPGDSTHVEVTLLETWAVELSPINDEQEVDTKTSITAIFESELNTSTVKPNTFGVYDNQGKLLSGLTIDDYEFYKDNKYCRITPPKQLAYNSTYKINFTPCVIFI
ncbi:MSCRAMM family protein, partial [[Eubacterium] cellulosolvens]